VKKIFGVSGVLAGVGAAALALRIALRWSPGRWVRGNPIYSRRESNPPGR